MEKRIAKICEQCGHLLSAVYANDEASFMCSSCGRIYPFAPEDTRRYKKVEGSNINMFEKILNNADRNPTLPKVFEDCYKCKKNVIVKQVRVGENMQLINKCTVCKNMWTN
jgi:DNA-directed RNA polymerase subunit M/transcription elongation factor TFIIS